MFHLDRSRPDVTWRAVGTGAAELEYIVRLLEDCIYTIEDGRPHRAAWRLADAGARLRHVLETDPTLRVQDDLRGLSVPSGLGCLLPALPRTDAP